MDKYELKIKELVGRHEGKTAELISILTTRIAKESPEQFNGYVNLVGKYEGKVAGEVASSASCVICHTPEQFNEFANLVGKYEDEVAGAVSHSASIISTEEGRKFDKFVNLVGKYEGEAAARIAGSALKISDFSSEQFSEFANSIGKYEDDIACEVAEKAEHSIRYHPETLEYYYNYLSSSKKVNKIDLEKIPEDIANKEMELLSKEKGKLKDKNNSIGLYRSLKNSGIDISNPSLSAEWKSEVQGVAMSFLEQYYPGINENISNKMNNALMDPNFISDLISFTTLYPRTNENAAMRLDELVRAYASKGDLGIKEYKEAQDNGLATKTKQGLSQVGKYTGSSSKDSDNHVYSDFANTIENLKRHIQETGDITDLEGEDVGKYSDQLSKLSNDVQDAFGEGFDSLLKLQKDSKGKIKKEVNQAIGIYKSIGALKNVQSLEKAKYISEEVELAKDMNPEEAGKYLTNLQEKYSSQIDDMTFSLEGIRKSLIEKEKPSAATVSNLIGVVDTLKNVGKSKESGFTARISHDLGELLTIGRYGNSGAGNCQQTSQSGWMNQSLMGFIGDANEEVVVVKDKGDEMVGFANLHGVKVDGNDGFIVESVYTNLTQSTSEMETAVDDLVSNLKKEGLRFFKKNDSGKMSKIEVLPSVVPRYLDSLGGQKFRDGGIAEENLVEM